jgi:hypothetical protein
MDTEYYAPYMPAPEQPPNALPAELARYLLAYRYACVSQSSDQGTVFVLKAPHPDIESLRGPLSMAIRHELYDHPASPVIRMVLTFYDNPSRPLAFESFINIQDPQQRADYTDLAYRPELTLLFYDETLTHQLSKRVCHAARAQVRTVLKAATRLHAGIPPERFDFERAKADVMRATDLGRP